ncbi:hypothetical protein [Pseudomonas brassicacearum]|uniref:hypothetical protein n=1 Tax=Pseudomonas brassicacearum TaxID=930166 RepID=UPI00030DBC61|nr:hypothetical protein [Pseudomonas brassicacearum]ROM94999.1 hypothetical protein BK657_27800 [Pseudomonas brassicacearum]ROM95864.1 hypothetical protein BK656_11390 [Pseudomonas brassicacearum]
MAQLVFVHGVATRDTPEYRASIANREKLFRELLFAPNDVAIHSPMWGQFVPSISHEVFSTDQGVGTYSLNVGTAHGLGAGLMGAGQVEGVSDISIGAVGKQDPVAALDAICSEIADRATREKRNLMPEELQAFRKASELIASNSGASAFVGDADAQTIADLLNAGMPPTYGIGSLIGDAVSAVTDRVRNAASTLGFGAIRGSLSPAIGQFMGDVFVYLKEGELRQKIRSEVGEALTKAHEGVKAGKGPLVIVGHSMGGVILIDMLTNPASSGLPEELKVDALLTVGSQPGFFAALDLLAHNLPAGSQRRKPDCVEHWLNIFDPIDPLAFRADMIFKDVIDLSFNSVAGITEAHSKYFQRPQFYARSRKRLQGFGIL